MIWGRTAPLLHLRVSATRLRAGALCYLQNYGWTDLQIEGKTERTSAAVCPPLAEVARSAGGGGGSTEITVFSKGRAIAAQSFAIGTLRIIQEQVKKDDWKDMKEWVKETAGNLKDFSMIGSGGNINRIAKLAQLKPGKSLTFAKLNEMVEDLKAHTFEERMKVYDLNPDRADVIVPAGDIFVNIMKWVDADKIFIPKIGLGDGIVREVYKEYLNGRKSTF